MFVRWLDEIADCRFDVAHLPGSRNPTDPLSRRGFADGDGPAASTGDADAESQTRSSSHGRAVRRPASDCNVTHYRIHGCVYILSLSQVGLREVSEDPWHQPGQTPLDELLFSSFSRPGRDAPASRRN